LRTLREIADGRQEILADALDQPAAGVIATDREFRRKNDILAAPFQKAGQLFFISPAAIHIGRVKKRDAPIKRCV